MAGIRLNSGCSNPISITESLHTCWQAQPVATCISGCLVSWFPGFLNTNGDVWPTHRCWSFNGLVPRNQGATPPSKDLVENQMQDAEKWLLRVCFSFKTKPNTVMSHLVPLPGTPVETQLTDRNTEIWYKMYVHVPEFHPSFAVWISDASLCLWTTL